MTTSSTVIDLSEARQRLGRQRQAENERNEPEWFDDIVTLAAYARLVKAEHAVESARIKFERQRDGITEAWWDGPEDIKERIHENNRRWTRYIALCARLASLPAQTRGQAQVKRNTIGKMWLSPDCSLGHDPKPGTIGESFTAMRAGCLADDHLFPRSLKMARN